MLDGMRHGVILQAQLTKPRDYTNKVAVRAFEPLVACAKCGSVEEPGAQLAACGWKLSRPAGSLIR